MAEKAMYEHLIRWAEHGVAPPTADLITLKPGSFDVDYDDNNTAKGGLRLPMVAVPINSFGEGRATLSDGCTELEPFSAEKLKSLYGTPENYLKKFSASTWGLIQDGYLLPEDANKLIEGAKAVRF